MVGLRAVQDADDTVKQAVVLVGIVEWERPRTLSGACEFGEILQGRNFGK
jgi:hypothetical protein